MVLKRPFQFVPAKGGPRPSGRQRVLAQWRGGVHLDPEEIAMRPSGKAVGQVLAGVLKDIRFDRRQEEAQIIKIWNAAIGPNITAHAQPTGINKGTLFVRVDNSAWLSEIVRYHRIDILKRMQAALGLQVIARISYQAG